MDNVAHLKASLAHLTGFDPYKTQRGIREESATIAALLTKFPTEVVLREAVELIDTNDENRQVFFRSFRPLRGYEPVEPVRFALIVARRPKKHIESWAAMLRTNEVYDRWLRLVPARSRELVRRWVYSCSSDARAYGAGIYLDVPKKDVVRALVAAARAGGKRLPEKVMHVDGYELARNDVTPFDVLRRSRRKVA